MNGLFTGAAITVAGVAVALGGVFFENYEATGLGAGITALGIGVFLYYFK